MSSDQFQVPKILIVDDQPENLRVLAQLLSSEDYFVQVARSGELALKAIAKQVPDLILLDIDMPDMDGIEVCLRLKSMKETASVPVIFVSALEQADIKVLGLETGGVDYITKPFVTDEIIARVQVHLEISRLQKALSETVAQLDERNQRLEMFATTLAHDMRAELGVVLTSSDMLVEEADSMDEAEDLAEIIQCSSQKLEEIVSSLFLLASAEKGEIELIETEMGSLVDASIQSIRQAVGHKTFEIQVDDLPVCKAHGPWVRRILDNYISNAVKYGGKQPCIKIYADVNSSDSDQVMHRYWVEDNGMGIPKDKREEVFLPYSRLEPDAAEGLGIGLSLVKRIAERMNGSVGLEDSEADGSRFYVELPA